MGKGCAIVALGLVGLVILVGVIETTSKTHPFDAATNAEGSLVDCASAPGVEPPNTARMLHPVEFAILQPQGGLQPTIEGRTNLPSGTRLIVTLKRKSPSYDAQSAVFVEPNGCFATEQFTEHGRDLVPGRYSVIVTMPVSSGQPDNVQRAIGVNGEYINGPLVKKFDHLGKVAEFKTFVTIVPENPPPVIDVSSDAVQAADETCGQLMSSRVPSGALIAMSTQVMRTNIGLEKDFMIVAHGQRLAIVCKFNNGVARLVSGGVMH